MTAAARAAAEENAVVCDRCHRLLGTSFFDNRWVCPACKGILEWRLLWRELQIEPGFQD